VYRELLAFPSLLRNQAASQLLGSLSQVEDQRATLLTRRTEADPDVQQLSSRVVELENQLSKLALAYLQGLTNQVRSLDTEIARFDTQLNRLPRKELEFARLERKPLVLKEMYTLLQTRLKEAEIAEAAVNSNISIVDLAVPPRVPIRPNRRLITLVGLIGGTLLGLAIALVREYADRSIKTRSDATAASGLPVLAIVPRIKRENQRHAIIATRSTAASQKALAAEHKAPSTTNGYTFMSGPSGQEQDAAGLPPASTGRSATVGTHPPARMRLSRMAGAVAEAYAVLQTNIAFSRPEEHIKVLSLTSALPGEGKTTSAVNLALTLCQRGLSVCLIDADMRRPQLHEVFHIDREPGLSEVLRGLQTLEGARRTVQIDEGRQLVVLPAGSWNGSAPALVGSTRMQTLLAELREEFDLVILDTPPVNLLTDAALVGVNTDAVILVVRAGSTDRAALEYAVEQLNHVRAPTLGIVLNDIDLKRFGAYDGAYKYYSYSAYTDPTVKHG
jgi:capsular exopolysaccharide synthesis family protein